MVRARGKGADVSEARLFTSESVTEGHPDKICDAISDSVLDALLADDPRSRVAVETLVTTGQVHVVGEVTTTARNAFADITDTVRNRILEIGYDSSDKGFDGETCGVNIGIGKQSPDIAQGVDTAHETRVGGGSLVSPVSAVAIFSHHSRRQTAPHLSHSHGLAVPTHS